MKLSLRNVGMINKADIEIGGLTIIAGKNNCGKSTVGKLLFSLITAVNRYKSVLGENKNTPLMKALEDIYRSIFETITFEHRISYSQYNLIRAFRPNIFLDDIEKNGFNSAREYRLQLLHTLFGEQTTNNSKYTDLKNLLNKLSEILSKEDKIEDILIETLDKLFNSEFSDDIENKINNFKFEILLSLGKNVKIKIHKKNNISSVDVSENINMEDLESLIPYKESLIIESPFIYGVHNSITASRATFEKRDMASRSIRFIGGIVQLHILDLMRKLKEQPYKKGAIDKIGISNIINGTFEYNRIKDEFEYKTNDKTYNAINIASGIKSFGTLQILFNGQHLNEYSLLILDEPEVHLHPEWQVKYAEVLIKMIKEYNIPILITTHSPYMLEALDKYSEKHKVDTQFYLADEGNIHQIANSNKNTLEEIFKKLNEPFKIFDEMENG